MNNIDKETYGLAMEHIKYYCDFQRKIKEFLQELPNRMTELLDSAAKLEKVDWLARSPRR